MQRLLVFLSLLVCLVLTPAISQAQCYYGRCFAPPPLMMPGPVMQPVYQLPPVVIVEQATAKPADGPQPTPDPCFSTCTPQGCFRPVYQPQPCHSSYSGHYRRGIGLNLGVNLSWNSRTRCNQRW